MYQIDLSKVPNQTVNVRLDNNYFKITVKTIDDGITTISVSCNDVEIVQNVRVISKTLLLPRYQQKGNFVFVTNDQIINYNNFGENSILYYISNEELYGD